jgi:hypothetical protein
VQIAASPASETFSNSPDSSWIESQDESDSSWKQASDSIPHEGETFSGQLHVEGEIGDPLCTLLPILYPV